MMTTSSLFLILYNGCLFRDIQAVQELTDILVFHGGRMLDQGGRKGNCLDIVTLENQFVLLFGGINDCHAWLHCDLADVLLAQEVTDLNDCVALRNYTVDGEMSMYGSHLVLESLGDT